MAATSGSRAVLITILMVFASVASTMEARKLLSNKENVNQHHQARRGDNDNNNNNIVPLSNLQDSLILASLPKGAVPSSTPSHKGHGLINTEQLSRHLAELDRILRSVPSPGAGN